MGQTCKVLAFDFGASSGRGIVFEYDGQSLKETEVHRFSNDPVMVNGHLYWDILRLFHEIKQGILKCMSGGHRDIEAIGIDTWGVDFALFDEQGSMMENSVPLPRYAHTGYDGIGRPKIRQFLFI